MRINIRISIARTEPQRIDHAHTMYYYRGDGVMCCLSIVSPFSHTNRIFAIAVFFTSSLALFSLTKVQKWSMCQRRRWPASRCLPGQYYRMAIHSYVLLTVRCCLIVAFAHSAFVLLGCQLSLIFLDFMRKSKAELAYADVQQNENQTHAEHQATASQPPKYIISVIFGDGISIRPVCWSAGAHLHFEK